MAGEKQHTPCLSEHREPRRGTFSFVFFLGGVCEKNCLHALCHMLAAIPAQGPSCRSVPALGPPWGPKMSSCLERESHAHGRGMLVRTGSGTVGPADIFSSFSVSGASLLRTPVPACLPG